jgi:cyclase
VTTPEADLGTLEPVAEGVWAWVQPDGSWWVSNAGLIAGSAGDVIFDTCATERRTTAFLRAVSSVRGSLDVRYAVNSHLHGDHTYGNSLLPASTVLVGHEQMREGLARDGIIDGCPPYWSPVPDWGAVTKRLPDLTVPDSARLHSGDRCIELRHPGWAAHTSGDVVAWVPDVGVLFTGDLLFHAVTPLIFMGSLRGAVRCLDWLASFGATHVVPGHGRPIPGSELDRVLDDHRRYYALVERTAMEAIRRGLAPLEAAREVELGEFADRPDAERIVLNLHRALAELDGRPFDLHAALADAVAYHGGPLPTRV